MKLTDLTVEVRNKDLDRIGMIRHEDLNLTATELFNNVGSWTLTLPSEHPLADVLRVPGAGIIVTGPDDVLFSGPVTSPVFEATPMDPVGTLSFEGVTDDVILRDYLAFPEPSNLDPTTQTLAHDVRTGNCESLLHAYVNANLGPGAPAARRKANLTMGTNGNRGPTIKKSARFPVIGNLLTEIAARGNLGFRVVQRNSSLVFETYAVTDRTATVRLDIDNGHLAGQKVKIQAPTATRVIVAGQNEGVDRQFIYRDTTESLAAEAAWGRRIERFRDQRQTDDVSELEGAGDEVLEEEGFTTISAQAVPVENSSMNFGTDWYLGDKVIVVVEDTEVSATVSGMALTATSDGFRVGVVIGDLSGVSTEAGTGNKIQTLEDRISQLEQNAETTAKVVLDGQYVAKAGDTMTGALTLSGAPTADLHPATKKYADDADALLLPKAGGTMTGALTLSGDPTSDLHAATRQYVDGQGTNSASAGTATALTANTWAAVNFVGSTNGLDYGGASWTSNTVFRLTKKGRYIVTGRIMAASNAAASNMKVGIGNGSAVLQTEIANFYAPANTDWRCNFNWVIEIASDGNNDFTIMAQSSVGRNISYNNVNIDMITRTVGA